MNPELKQLYASANLAEKLLIEKVIALTEEEVSREREEYKQNKRDRLWMEFMCDGFEKMASEMNNPDRYFVGNQIKALRASFERMHPKS